VENPTLEAPGQAIVMNSLQVIPKGTNNVVCFTVIPLGTYVVGVHQSLFVKEGKDHLLRLACLDLLLGEA
jgi:hypothetical protein